MCVGVQGGETAKGRKREKEARERGFMGVREVMGEKEEREREEEGEGEFAREKSAGEREIGGGERERDSLSSSFFSIPIFYIFINSFFNDFNF